MRTLRQAAALQRRDDTGRVRAQATIALRALELLPGVSMLVFDRELRFTMATGQALERHGWKRDKLLGRRLEDAVPLQFAELLSPYYEAALEGRTVEIELRSQDGTAVYQTTFSPVNADDGTVVGGMVIARDITTEVEAAAGESRTAARYRALARSIPNGFVLLFDEEHRYLSADGAALSDWGFASEDVVGRTPDALFEPELVAFLADRYDRVLRGETVEWERKVAGQVYALRAGPVREDDGSVSGGMVVAQNVTERAEAAAESSALHRVAAAAAANVGAGALLSLVAEEVGGLLEARAAVVARFDGSAEARLLAVWPPDRAGNGRRTMPLDGTNAISLVARTGRSARLSAAGDDPAARDLAMRVAAPVVIDGKLWGAIGAGAARGELPEGAEDHLARFAGLVATAIANAEAWERLAREATTDGITGIANSRAFRRRLEQEAAAAVRHGLPLSVVVFDLDRFKGINDTFGHPAGDRVLTGAAHVLLEQARKHELVARLGGEEFGWILPQTDAAGAFAAAERARRAFEHHEFDAAGRVTVSAGVGSLGDDGDVESLMRRADLALYAAKAAGRNRTHGDPEQT